MGAIKSKVAEVREMSRELRREYVVARVGLFPFVLADNVLMGIIDSFLSPPKQESPTVREMRTRWEMNSDVDLWPTKEETEATLQRLQYREDRLHFAVCGPAGSGKSSLINAFRGMKGQSPGAAPVGIVEKTTEVTRYPDTRPGMPYELFVWYDIPGAGTTDVPSTQYFKQQGLFIFDFIVLVYDTRFTEIDAKILKNCRKYNIPAFIVRSKANQHIQNMLLHDDELENAEARDQYIRETRQNLDDNLKKLDLYDDKSRCYIVSDTSMYSLIKSMEAAVGGAEPGPRKNADRDIDEVQLLADLFKTAFDRRYKQPPVR